MKKVILFSIKNKLVTLLFVGVLVTWGVYSLFNLPIDAVPDITNNQVQVISLSSKLAALEMEQYVSRPIELAVKNIPGILEVRSVSRFGLSVVTIVFKDETDIYWARNQVNERLQEAASKIPSTVEKPTLAPITTGLGEIYQYTLEPEPAFESKYSLMELRTLQDWVVKKQMIGVKGVADVSSFGGKVKEYQVKLIPDQLSALNISVREVYEALTLGNSNTGGSYIEKSGKAFFVRGLGTVTNLEDIKNILIKNINNVPIKVSDVATVELGSGLRYGGLTIDGKGEAVGGIVLMLKGENSSRVINEVKSKITEIEKQLPAGLHIKPFLDREVLVDKAIHTIIKNLIEGGLIVIFVLILFMGSIKSGIIVASVIPLSMLFALGMMVTFGVSGNLMSLGAIDFGLIIDGAVIIVENVVRRITDFNKSKLGKATFPDEKRQLIGNASAEMLQGGAFGQIIIMIVYLPLLGLSGIEGKMFQPMALTVIFALIGALLLSFTYVPMMSDLLLSNANSEHNSFFERILEKLKKTYIISLKKCISVPWLILISAIGLLVFSIGVFSTLGGEFIPKLDEGDYALETRLPQGTSLETSIEVSGNIEKKLLESFPDEISKVVAKIGSSEIPVDPMPMEAMDLIIMVKEKEFWKKVKTKKELTESINTKLKDFPGIQFSIQQPIEMRFNELITGARTDVVVQLYGEDLEILKTKADEISEIIKPVKGATDVMVQKISGLPQYQIKYNRQNLNYFGIKIEDVNQVIETAFAGSKAGVIFEGDKVFDLTLRLMEDSRNSEEDLQNLMIKAPNGNFIPLNELADINLVSGPSEISRYNSMRRINVTFNVRDRDVESTAMEVKSKLEKRIDLPSGYYIHFGGQFENLLSAKKRLMIIVPFALVFIIILLYMAFGSILQSLMIFSAVPLAAIGGVFALWVTGIPFSISAGVGFIALFGVAVLNGIVMISYFNELEKSGIKNIYERILQSAETRFRPVLMTATVASLGFLPMAISSGAGAEVQKPLATVVIGGLITSTFLTLVVLPVLYLLFNKRKTTRSKMTPLIVPLLMVLMFLPFSNVYAQKVLTEQSVIKAALNYYPALKESSLNLKREETLNRTAFSLPPTNVYLESPTANFITVGIQQNFDFPLVYFQNKKLLDGYVKTAGARVKSDSSSFVFTVRSVYLELQFLHSKIELLKGQDSLLNLFSNAANVRFNTGETSYLEQLTADSKKNFVKATIEQTLYDFNNTKKMLEAYCGINLDSFSFESLERRNRQFLLFDSLSFSNNPEWQMASFEYNNQDQLIKVEKCRMLPGFYLGYLNQGSVQSPVNLRFQYGITLPVWFGPQLARIKAAKLSAKQYEQKIKEKEINLSIRYADAKSDMRKNLSSLKYFEESGLIQAAEIERVSHRSFETGELDFTSFLQSMSLSSQIRLEYIQTLKSCFISKLVLDNLLNSNEFDQ
jgi:cobalt-zinc-cadmium resistance protein CzcA